MFERSLEEMTARVFLESKDVSILDQTGVSVFPPGDLELTYQAAAALIEKMKRLQVGVPKRLQPRYRAVMGSIRNAFGPEFLERH